MTLCQHIIKGAAYLTTGPFKKYRSCRTNGVKGGRGLGGVGMTGKAHRLCRLRSERNENLEILANLFSVESFLFFRAPVFIISGARLKKNNPKNSESFKWRAGRTSSNHLFALA